MLDAYGNYVVGPQTDFPPSPTPVGGGILSGVGAPDDSLGSNGNVYINVSNGDIYTKSGDTWTLKSGGSGAVEVITGSVDDPTGTVTPTDPTKIAIYRKDSDENIEWYWRVSVQAWRQSHG